MSIPPLTEALDAARLMIDRYLERTQKNVERHDRVYVQVRKEDMVVLLQLADIGLAAFRRRDGKRWVSARPSGR
jgi:hypothetical protein